MVQARPIDRFLELAAAAVLAGAAGNAANAAARVAQALNRAPQPVAGNHPAQVPGCAHLPAAAAAMRAALPDLAAAFAAIAPLLPWSRRTDLAAEPGFSEGHANARVLGPHGLEERGGLVAGFSLVAPGVTYPDHDHPPEEIYLALSGGQWWQHGSAWHAPGAGGIVHNPPGIRHAMRGTDVPLLAIWFLLPDACGAPVGQG